MAKFRINYSKVMQQAVIIDQLSSELKQQSNQIAVMEAEIQGDWQGPASETFLKQLNALQQDIASIYMKMAKLATTVKTIASKIQREDEASAARAASLPENHSK